MRRARWVVRRFRRLRPLERRVRGPCVRNIAVPVVGERDLYRLLHFIPFGGLCTKNELRNLGNPLPLPISLVQLVWVVIIADIEVPLDVLDLTGGLGVWKCGDEDASIHHRQHGVQPEEHDEEGMKETSVCAVHEFKYVWIRVMTPVYIISTRRPQQGQTPN